MISFSTGSFKPTVCNCISECMGEVTDDDLCIIQNEQIKRFILKKGHLAETRGVHQEWKLVKWVFFFNAGKRE